MANINDVMHAIEKFEKKNDKDHAAIYRAVNTHSERITALETIQDACRERQAQNRRGVIDVVSGIIKAIIIVGLGLAAGIAITGCQTPESLKVSHDTAGQALDYGMDLVGGNENILKPLRDAKTLYGPSDLFIGPPKRPVNYDPETTQVDFLAAQANLEVKMQKMLKDFTTDLAKNILPAQLSAFLPGKSESGGEPFDQNGMILKIVGIIAGLYASWKGTGAVVKKIKNGKNKI